MSDKKAPQPLKLNDKNFCSAVSAGLQLLYCAHVHSNKKLFKYWWINYSTNVRVLNTILNEQWPIIDFHKFTTSSAWLEETFNSIAKDIGPAFKNAIACQDPERKFSGDCICSKDSKSFDAPLFLRYAEKDEIHSKEDFSYAWSQLSRDEKCKCGKEMITGFFLRYPNYLFVLCDNSYKLFESARHHQFNIGLSAVATYTLLGAVLRREVKNGTSVQHISFVYMGGYWYCCCRDLMEKVNSWDRYNLPDFTVETLLFVQTDIRSSTQCDSKPSDFDIRADSQNSNFSTQTDNMDFKGAFDPISSPVVPRGAEDKISPKVSPFFSFLASLNCLQAREPTDNQSDLNKTLTYGQGITNSTNQLNQTQNQLYPQINPMQGNPYHSGNPNPQTQGQNQPPQPQIPNQNYQHSVYNNPQFPNAAQYPNYQQNPNYQNWNYQNQNINYQQNPNYQNQNINYQQQGSVAAPYSPIPSQPTTYLQIQAPTMKLLNLGNSCWIAAGLQMLFCANWHSGKRLFDFSRINLLIQEFYILMNQPPVDVRRWKSFYDMLFTEIPEMHSYRHKQGDAGKFYEIFIEYLQKHLKFENKGMLACSGLRPTTEGCMLCPRLTTEESQVFMLQYSGRDDFNSSEEFLREWKVCFEYEMQCEHNKQVTKKNYFLYWPNFLFVITSSPRQLVINAAKYPLTIGDKGNQVTYTLIGAAMHTGTPWYGGHYTAAVLFDSWYLCNDSHSQKVQLADIHGDVQLLLFKRVGGIY